MSHKKKITVLILGGEDSLNKNLKTQILRTELNSPQEKKRFKKMVKKYISENDTYVIKCPRDLNNESDVKELINQNPDMCLLVVKEGFSEEKVSSELEKLHTTTGKPKEEFIVVLPPSCKQSQTSHPSFSSYTVEDVVSKLSKLAEERQANESDERHTDHPESHVSPSHTRKEATGVHPGTKVNLVLVGLAGTGKSASGNTILGKQVFISRPSSNPVTTECKEADAKIDGRSVRVIDTPDMFDEEIKPSVKNEHVSKCKQLCGSEPRVYLLVMQVSRFTDCERDILEKMEEAFGSRVQEQTVILFTRGDDLKRADMSLEDFLSSCQPDLKKIVEKCEKRCVLFENRAPGERQVKELMQTVDKVLNKMSE